MFTTDTSPTSCIDAIIDKVSLLPEYQGKSRSFIYDSIAQQIRISTSEFLQKQGINVNDLPADIKSKLPDINLMDLLTQFKRLNIKGVDDKQEDTPDCVIPIDVVRRMRDETDDATIQARRIPSQSVGDDRNSVFYNAKNLQCKLGNQLYLSTLPESLAGRDLTTLSTQNPGQFNFHGCRFPYDEKDVSRLKPQLEELYAYSDFETMKTLRKVMSDYKASIDARNTSTIINTTSSNTKSKAIADMNAAKMNETVTNNNKQTQAVALQSTIQPLSNSTGNFVSTESRLTSAIVTRS